MTKHQQRSEDTKLKLLKAARRIFARDGFEASKIDEIARAAGFTRGAFYAHFPAKEDLFFALLEQQTERRLERIGEVLEQQADDDGRWNALRDHYVANLNDRQWPILLLEFKLYALRHPKLRAKMAQAHRRISRGMKLERLAKAMPTVLQIDADCKEQMRIGLEAMMCGLVVQQAYDPESISRPQAEALLGDYFRNLIQGLGCGTLH